MAETGTALYHVTHIHNLSGILCPPSTAGTLCGNGVTGRRFRMLSCIGARSPSH